MTFDDRLVQRWLASRVALRTDAGDDLQAEAMGGGITGTLASGAATSVTATSLTNTGASWTTDQWKGHIVFTGPNSAGTGSTVYGIVQTNSGTVLTVDQWYVASTHVAGTTPNGTCSYLIAPGNAPGWWISYTENATAPVATDTQLAGELVVGTSAGLERSRATWAHTAGASSYTLTKTNTLTGATARTLNKVAISNSAIDAANQRMLFESAMPNPPVLVTSDQVTTTETITT